MALLDKDQAQPWGPGGQGILVRTSRIWGAEPEPEPLKARAGGFFRRLGETSPISALRPLWVRPREQEGQSEGILLRLWKWSCSQENLESAENKVPKMLLLLRFEHFSFHDFSAALFTNVVLCVWLPVILDEHFLLKSFFQLFKVLYRWT